MTEGGVDVKRLVQHGSMVGLMTIATACSPRYRPEPRPWVEPPQSLPIETPTSVPPLSFPEPTPQPPGGCVMHEVAGGESLSALAARFLGDANRWKEIWNVNQDQIPNPRIIRRGQMLKICLGDTPPEPGVGPANQFEGRLNRDPLPLDTVPKEILENQYHTKIWQATGNVNLYLRAKMLEDKLFKDLQSGAVSQLDIVLVNANELKSFNLSPEQKQGLPEVVQSLEDREKQPPKPGDEGKITVGMFIKSNRVYLLVAVGGQMKPTTDQSFPNPNDYDFIDDFDYPIGGVTAGFSLRHEIAHYGFGHPDADYESLKGVHRAWANKHKNNDDTWYYLLFETPQGLIYTKGDTQKPQKLVDANEKIPMNAKWYKNDPTTIEGIKSRLAAKALRKRSG